MVIEVVGLVENAREARAELRDAGFQADVVGVPAAPSLVGDIVAVSADTDALEIVSDGPTVEKVRVLGTQTGRLTVVFGRTARPGESYEATEPPLDCESLAGKLVDGPMRQRLREKYGPSIRWREEGPAGRGETSAGDLRRGARIVSILPLGPNEALVAVSDGRTEIVEGRC